MASFQRALEKFERDGREKILRSREPKPMSDKEKTDRVKSLGPKVQQILAAQDAQGRWIKSGKVKKASVGDDGYLDMSLFIENLRALAEFLEAAK